MLRYSAILLLGLTSVATVIAQAETEILSESTLSLSHEGNATSEHHHTDKVI